MGRRVTLPEHVRLALEVFFGASVASVHVIEHSWFVRLHGRAIATTRRRRIYLRGSGADFFDDSVLMLHEYCHVLKQWEPGILTTARYVLEWLQRGYWANRFEVEAREFAALHSHRLHALLGCSAQQRLATVEATSGPSEGDRQGERNAHRE